MQKILCFDEIWRHVAPKNRKTYISEIRLTGAPELWQINFSSLKGHVSPRRCQLSLFEKLCHTDHYVREKILGGRWNPKMFSSAWELSTKNLYISKCEFCSFFLFMHFSSMISHVSDFSALQPIFNPHGLAGTLLMPIAHTCHWPLCYFLDLVRQN